MRDDVFMYALAAIVIVSFFIGYQMGIRQPTESKNQGIGYSEVVIDGVVYLQNENCLSVKFNREGKVEIKKKEK